MQQRQQLHITTPLNRPRNTTRSLLSLSLSISPSLSSLLSVCDSLSLSQFKLLLIEIAMSCQCFGEETKEFVTANDSFGKQQRRRGELVGRVASLLWHMENSAGYEKMSNRDRSRPVTVPFKANHQMLVLSEGRRRDGRGTGNGQSQQSKSKGARPTPQSLSKR
jgi:hypothetical protein